MNDASAQAALLEAAEHPIDMILETGWFITKDEHRADGAFPILDETYTRAILHEFYTERLIVLPKSRQMLASWLVAAYLVAKLLTTNNLLAIYQTKREDDALSFMERCYWIYNRLPAWLRKIRAKQTGPKENRYKLEVPKSGSKIWGIPSGADVIRMNTVSIFVSDEVNFQPEAKGSLRAAGPSLGATGQGIWLSSANAGGLIPLLVKGSW